MKVKEFLKGFDKDIMGEKEIHFKAAGNYINTYKLDEIPEEISNKDLKHFYINKNNQMVIEYYEF